jgi:iron uptake system component EfeO
MRASLPLAPAILVFGVGLAACSSDQVTAGSIAVTSTATECRVAQTTMAAGRHSFEVQNTGSDVTEVYVYGPGDKVVAEKENIGPSTKATFSATLAPGRYEVACKPGQTGSGIRQTITVT